MEISMEYNTCDKQLQARIAKAIEQNTCPFTTNADIAYFEQQDYEKELKEMNDNPARVDSPESPTEPTLSMKELEKGMLEAFIWDQGKPIVDELTDYLIDVIEPIQFARLFVKVLKEDAFASEYAQSLLEAPIEYFVIHNTMACDAALKVDY
tara:strand:+ start:669 stop:1124 length:456 start_codon:yes stop_codon:yes gene_type:complete